MAGSRPGLAADPPGDRLRREDPLLAPERHDDRVLERATHSVDGSPSHAEVGFWRVTADGTLEISVAIGGAVEVSEGTIAAEMIELASSGVVRAGTSHRFAGTARHYRLEPDRITYEVELATVDHPLSGHLRGELRRVG